MIFSVLSNIILGISGGIISSIIVSRVFLIFGDYQNQLRFFDQLMHKLGYIAGILTVVKKVFEVSYDEDIRIQREMKEKGYKSEAEYYQAHSDKDWISQSGLLKTFSSEVYKIAQSIKDELFALHIEYPQLAKIRNDISSHVDTILDLEEFTFSNINKLDKESRAIADDYSKIKSMTAKQLIKLIVTDKVMIVLYVLVAAILTGAIFSYFLGI